MSGTPATSRPVDPTPHGARGPRRRASARGWPAALLVLAVLACAVLALRSRLGVAGGPGGLPSPAVCAALVGVNLAGNLLLADAWRVLVRAAGPSLSLAAAARVWTVSQLARYTIGAAQVPGRALAARRHGVPASAGVLTTLAEIAWGTSVTAALLLVTAPAWLPAGGALDAVALAAVVPVAVLGAGLVAPAAALAGIARVLDHGLLRRLGGGRLAAGLDRVAVTRSLAVGITLRYVLVVGLRVLGVVVLYGALGGDVSGDWQRAAGAWALGHLAGQLAVVVPGGLGVRESATALVLTPALGLEGAIALAALVRLAELAAELAAFAAVRLLPNPPPAPPPGPPPPGPPLAPPPGAAPNPPPGPPPRGTGPTGGRAGSS